MKACLLRTQAPIEQKPLDFTEVPTPEPAENEVLIRVHVCGICRTDLHVVEGDLPPHRMPIIPGHQVIGRVVRLGTELNSEITGIAQGQRVGVAWLHRTCGTCRFCLMDRENLCDHPTFTGWTTNGGFAEYAVAPASFVYPIPDIFSDTQAAPLLCAGIIGYRSLEQTGLGVRPGGFKNARLGIYGFGAAGHVVIQLARARGCQVYVFTRDRQQHRKLASELGAVWTGGVDQQPPVRLDASIIFAPAGELIPRALKTLDKGGRLVLGGIYMSPTPPLEYQLLYYERTIRSVANNTRSDGHAFLVEAASIPVRTHVEIFPLTEANQALHALKNKAIKGAGVLAVNQERSG